MELDSRCATTTVTEKCDKCNEEQTQNKGYTYFTETLGSPKLILAPMVDASELPFRMLTRKYKADMCYTPMLHAKLFATNAKYRAKYFTTCPQDRPLVVQFCANDPEYLLEAAKLVQDSCDAVDINFGCPQGIAKKGNYGSFLLENVPLIKSLVSTLHQNLTIPVFCKIRLLPTEEATFNLVDAIVASGCQLLAVHGRTKENKGRYATPADYTIIRKIKERIPIPLIANGSISTYEDIQKCLEETKADGVMTAYPHLINPAFFDPTVNIDTIEMSLEFLDLCEKYPISTTKMARGHLYKILKDELNMWGDLRKEVSDVRSFASLKEIVLKMKQRKVDGVGPIEMEKPKPKVVEQESDDESYGLGLFNNEEY